MLLLVGVVAAAVNELKAFDNPAAGAAMLAGLGVVALLCMLRTNRMAAPRNAELRYEEIRSDQLVSLDLS